jgi:hypothetical protein
MAGEGRYLALDERLVTRVRRHPAVLSVTILQTLGVVVLGLILSGLIGSKGEAGAIDTVLAFIIMAAVARLGWRLWEWSVDRIVVTDRRILEVSGLLSRKVASMPLDKVTDMTYRRTFVGRLVGYGAFIVESPGQKQAVEMINFIPQPDDFYQTVTSLVMGGPEMSHEDLPVPDADDDDTGPLPRVIVLGDDH